MQTFRECERDLLYATDANSTCNAPQTFADMVCGPIASTDSPQVAAATRAMMFGGGHLQLRYNSAIISSDEAPCLHSIKVVTALIVLPLLEDDQTPAYIPNLAITRRQDSVVHATQADTDENILWLYDEQLDLLNLSCQTGGGSTQCPFFLCASNGGGTCCNGDSDVGFNVATTVAHYGRFRVDHTVRVRRRLKEREAIFLLTEFVNGGAQEAGDFVDWPIRRNVYFRYAVRPSR